MSTPVSLPHGSRVLVTGANGFVASHVVKQLLEQGYNVRGTVRSLTQSDWLLKNVFPAEIKSGALEIVQVEDMNADRAFDVAIKDIAAVIHPATITALDPDPNKVVPPTVSGVVNLLKTAAKQPTVKSFVYTSSIVAAAMPMPDVPFSIDSKSWNEPAVQMAYSPPPYTPERIMLSYAASKVKAEQAFWRFVEEEKPPFKANAVLPYTVFGPLLDAQQKPSTDAWIFYCFDDNAGQLSNFQGLTQVDVRDVAALHLAAALDPSVKDARLYAWSEPFNWNDALAILRRLRPDAKVAEDFEGLGKTLGSCDDAEEKRLLKKWSGRESWIPLETCLRDTIDGPWPVNKGVF